MKKYFSFILIFLVLILLQGNLFGQDLDKISNATLVFEEENYDFGDVGDDSDLIHVFKFENSGTDTLFIQSVRGS